ncbi:MAG: hypothetical protein FWD53_07935 [Phycisphaerales bacterium]|nr:hypothetical protein [Phycisphaerales bacterium]
MSKRELIDEIRQVNRTASPEFLARFQENDLKAYLDRMCAIADSLVESMQGSGMGTEGNSLVAA